MDLGFGKKKVHIGSDGSKSPKDGPKVSFLWFWQKYYPFKYAFLLQFKSVNGLLTF